MTSLQGSWQILFEVVLVEVEPAKKVGTNNVPVGHPIFGTTNISLLEFKLECENINSNADLSFKF